METLSKAGYLEVAPEGEGLSNTVGYSLIETIFYLSSSDMHFLWFYSNFIYLFSAFSMYSFSIFPWNVYSPDSSFSALSPYYYTLPR